MAEAEELERAKQQKEKKSYNFKKTTVSLNSKKPVNFTFTSKGKVLYKKRVDTDQLPEQAVEALQITNISAVKNLSAIQRKKELLAKQKAEQEA